MQPAVMMMVTIIATMTHMTHDEDETTMGENHGSKVGLLLFEVENSNLKHDHDDDNKNDDYNDDDDDNDNDNNGDDNDDKKPRHAQ